MTVARHRCTSGEGYKRTIPAINIGIRRPDRTVKQTVAGAAGPPYAPLAPGVLCSLVTHNVLEADMWQPGKPSSNEDEYFARRDAEWLKEQRAKLDADRLAKSAGMVLSALRRDARASRVAGCVAGQLHQLPRPLARRRRAGDARARARARAAAARARARQAGELSGRRRVASGGAHRLERHRELIDPSADLLLVESTVAEHQRVVG